MQLLWRWAFGVRLSLIIKDVQFALGWAASNNHSVSKTPSKPLVSEISDTCEASSSSTKEVGEGNGGHCVSCLTAEKRVAMLPCGHLCLCQPCTRNMMQFNDANDTGNSTNRCPVCRADVQSIQVLHISNKLN